MSLPVPYKDFTPGPKYEAFILEVSKLLDLDVQFLKEDPSWYWCYDDGYSPEKAVQVFQAAMSSE